LPGATIPATGSEEDKGTHEMASARTATWTFTPFEMPPPPRVIYEVGIKSLRKNANAARPCGWAAFKRSLLAD
jgi:hypothetical protein